MRLFFFRLITHMKKDLLLERRSASSFISILFFSLLIVLVFQFGFDILRWEATPLLCPFVWLTTLFGGILRMNRTFEGETESKMMDVLRLMKNTAIPIYLSKLIFNLTFVIVLEVIVLVTVLFLFNIPTPLESVSYIGLPLLLGTLGFVIVGTTFSGMLMSEKGRDLILPVIAYPILTPVIVGVIQSVDYSISGEVMGVQGDWIRILVSFDVIYLIASVMVFDRVMDSY